MPQAQARISPEALGYRFGPFEFSLERKRLRREGQTIELRFKAVQVLEYLLRRRGRLVPRSELLRDVWADTVVSDGSLTQAVWEIRRALHDNRREPQYVYTVHNRGYRFVGAVEYFGVDLAIAPTSDATSATLKLARMP